MGRIDMSAVSKNYPMSFRHLGYGLFYGWLFVCFFEGGPVLPALSSRYAHHGWLYLYFLGALAFTFLPMAIVGPRFSPLVGKKTFLFLSAFLTTAGTVSAGILISLQKFESPAGIATMILAGAGGSLLTLGWGEFFGSVPVKRGGLYFCFSMAVAFLSYIVISHVEPTASIVLTAMLPLLSVFLLMLNRKEIIANTPRPAEANSKVFPLPLKVVWGMLVFGVSLGFMFKAVTDPRLTSSILEGNGPALGAQAIVALLLAVGILVFQKDLDWGLTFRPVLPLMGAGLFLLPLLQNNSGSVPFVVTYAGYSFFSILCWLIYSDLAFRARVPSVRIFGTGRFIILGSIFVGELLGANFKLGSLGSSTVNAMALGLLYVMLTSTVFLLNERDMISGWGLANPARTDEDEEDTDVLTGLAAKFDLTAREKEIFFLLAKGWNLPYIEEHFRISHNTAKFHARNIYRKLCVHKRQELLQLIEECTEKPQSSAVKPNGNGHPVSAAYLDDVPV
ncbi:MAG: helix-turn-helix transcriptional regulator [Candidatus Aquicultorales bacterium]